MNMRILLACLLAALPGLACANVIVTPIASGFPVATTVNANTHLAGDDRIFVLSKTGTIRAYDQGSASVSTFLDLSAETHGSSADELGLLGLAFDPGYAANGRFYVFMTTQPVSAGPVYAQVRRYTDPAIAAEAAQTVWQADMTGVTNHVGGWIDFDASGKLLISVGDGGNGSASDVRHTGQDPSDIFGSILRIDLSADAFAADPFNNYTPAGTVTAPGAIPELYAYGVRNPYRNSVAPDGNLIIADVGQESREELTILAPGDLDRNLGWSLREGNIPTPLVGGPVPADYQAPDFVYDHGAGDRAVIGGFVYRGTAVPELFGRYVFGDEVSGNIWSIRYTGSDLLDGTLQLIGNIPGLSSFGETVDGELITTQYKFSAASGWIYRLGSDGVLAAAVPEAGSWALMLAGLGLCGAALRARRSRARALAG